MRSYLAAALLAASLIVAGCGSEEPKPAVPGVPATPSTPATTDFKALVDQTTTTANEAVDVMKKITDKASAEANKPALEGLVQKAQDLFGKFKAALPSAGLDAATLGPKATAAIAAFEAERSRLMNNADIKAVLDGIFK